STVRADPALLFVFLNRHIPFAADVAPMLAESDRRAAVSLVANDGSIWQDWNDPAIRPVVRTALAAANFALLISDATAAGDAALAWARGWLALAGWLAVGVVAPESIVSCGTDPTFSRDPFGTQVRHWGMRRAEVAWRLAAKWPLPNWATTLM